MEKKDIKCPKCKIKERQTIDIKPQGKPWTLAPVPRATAASGNTDCALSFSLAPKSRPAVTAYNEAERVLKHYYPKKDDKAKIIKHGINHIVVIDKCTQNNPVHYETLLKKDFVEEHNARFFAVLS
jgi:hypothetical protein